MLYAVLSVLVTAALGSQRLLQQAPPQFVAIATTAKGATPAATATTKAATPAAAVTTKAAATTTKAATTKAATTKAPAFIPTTTKKATAGPVVIPNIPGLGLPTPPMTQKSCMAMYTDPTGCAGKTDVIGNPAELFNLNCGGIGSCAQAQFVLQFAAPHRIESIDTLMFSAQYAGYQSVITVDNQQIGNKVVIERLICAVPTACDGLTIILENAHLNDLDCAEANYCANCFIKKTVLDPSPKACYGW